MITLAVLGTAYLIFVRCTGTGIPCLVKKVTGLSCPGCGITRMIAEASRLNFSGAFQANPFLFCTWPLIPLFFIINRRERLKKTAAWMMKLYLVFLVLWGIVRNM